MAKKIGIVTGIALEENLLRKAFKRAGHGNSLTACAAGTVVGAQKSAESLIEQGASHLISFGVCGGLSPYVKAGDLILADQAAMNGIVLPVTKAWQKAALTQLPNAKTGIILSVDTPITTAAAKHQAYESTSAIAVDVESFAVMQAAKNHNLPCLIIRAVLDGAKQELPETALSGVDENGNTQIWPVIKALLKRPQDLPALIDLTRASGRAQETLKAIIKKGAPDFWVT